MVGRPGQPMTAVPATSQDGVAARLVALARRTASATTWPVSGRSATSSTALRSRPRSAARRAPQPVEDAAHRHGGRVEGARPVLAAQLLHRIFHPRGLDGGQAEARGIDEGDGKLAVALGHALHVARGAAAEAAVGIIDLDKGDVGVARAEEDGIVERHDFGLQLDGDTEVLDFAAIRAGDRVPGALRHGAAGERRDSESRHAGEESGSARKRHAAVPVKKRPHHRGAAAARTIKPA